MITEVDELLTVWAEAERSCDRESLDALLTDDFVGVGPVGFMLPKQAWLSRFGQGLHYDHLDLDEVSTRRHGDAAVVVAHQRAVGQHQGNPTPGDTRVSFVVVGTDGAGLQIAGIQYSFLGHVPGSR
ncbi:MAG: nuclear transport factor 2 family protein [Acidimicrobiales bacterium]